ncbi:MAG: GNAT family N-acetyltransferase [Ktedonobacteraceae bacterium]
MTITRHPFRGEADMPRILDLVDSMPLTCPHVIDLPWRLSSPAINEGRDAAFWQDSGGRVVGFAAWQYDWAALDFFILPGPQQSAIEVDLFAWVDERFRERDEERGQPLPYWVEFQDDDQARRQLVEERGFLHDEGDRRVLLQHALADLAPVPTPPAGFMLRPLAGAQETAAYAEVHRAAFESTSMTPEWRARTIRMPQYRSELDLVVTAPDGSLAGFCIGWLVPERRVAQIEPIGVHPRFQRLGLGRILLLEMLRRFKAQGASSAIIEPYTGNAPIHRACEAVGFQQAHTIRSKGKWLTQTTAMK